MKFTLVLLLTTCVLHTTSGFASVKSYFNHNSQAQYKEPYRNITRPGDDLEKVIITQINSAKKSVFVAVQELRLPLIAQAMIERRQAGVDVRLILENNYNFDSAHQRDTETNDEHDADRSAELRAFVDLNKNRKLETSELEVRDAIYMLRKAGVPIMDDTFGGSKGAGLMHHKFVIVDDRKVIVSTANFTMSCIHGDMLTAASRGNPNSLMVVESAAFADIFTEEFTLMWGSGKIGNFGLQKSYRGPRSVMVNGGKITVQFSPTSKTHGWDNSVNGLIGRHLNKATKSVKGALFVFSDQNLANIMEKRNAVGVNMGFIIETKFAYREYSELLDMLGLEMLNTRCQPEPLNKPWKKPIAEGGMAGSRNGDILHHKFAVVDEKAVIVGSQNWTESANYQNDETLLVIESPSVSSAYSREYARIKTVSVMGAPASVISKIKQQEVTCAGR